MALRNKSLFNYGLEITTFNRSLDFRTTSGGPIRMATLNVGFYTLSALVIEVARAMTAADPSFTYTVSVDRTVSSGTQNRATIATSGAYLDLLFGTGPRVATSVAMALGFASTDKTGSTSYVGSTSAGTILIPDYVGYSYLGPEMVKSVFGSLNISARGDKEAIVWQIQKFFQMEFRYEPEAKVIAEWSPLMTWCIQQKPLEFTPDITSPTIYYQCTLETTELDGKGLGYRMTEMLPEFPFFYRTGMLKFRQKVS